MEFPVLNLFADYISSHHRVQLSLAVGMVSHCLDLPLHSQAQLTIMCVPAQLVEDYSWYPPTHNDVKQHKTLTAFVVYRLKLLFSHNCTNLIAVQCIYKYNNMYCSDLSD